MTAALTPDMDGLQGTSGLSADMALRQAASFLAHVVKQGASDPPGKRDRLGAEGLNAALQKAPTLEWPVVVYRDRLPDAVLEAFEEGEEEVLLDQVFGDIAHTSTSLSSGFAREYGGSSRFPDSVGKITLPRRNLGRRCGREAREATR